MTVRLWNVVKEGEWEKQEGKEGRKQRLGRIIAFCEVDRVVTKSDTERKCANESGFTKTSTCFGWLGLCPFFSTENCLLCTACTCLPFFLFAANNSPTSCGQITIYSRPLLGMHVILLPIPLLTLFSLHSVSTPTTLQHGHYTTDAKKKAGDHSIALPWPNF
jgi:hypothetical protein